MKFVLLLLTGILGGILGGMGMGGGTLTIPLLTELFNVSQRTAQAVNLIGFIPMAIVAIIIHLKNKLINFKGIWWMISFGVATCILGCFLSKAVSSDILKRLFGVFLLLLSVYQFYTIVAKKR